MQHLCTVNNKVAKVIPIQECQKSTIADQRLEKEKEALCRTPFRFTLQRTVPIFHPFFQKT